MLAQSLGFRRYLATAEANQLRFEEGEDIFSRYLPYAIVFGLADRWARVFSELAAQGRARRPAQLVRRRVLPGREHLLGDRVRVVAGPVPVRGDRVDLRADARDRPAGPGSRGGGFSGGGVGGGGGGGW